MKAGVQRRSKMSSDICGSRMMWSWHRRVAPTSSMGGSGCLLPNSSPEPIGCEAAKGSPNSSCPGQPSRRRRFLPRTVTPCFGKGEPLPSCILVARKNRTEIRPWRLAAHRQSIACSWQSNSFPLLPASMLQDSTWAGSPRFPWAFPAFDARQLMTIQGPTTCGRIRSGARVSEDQIRIC